MRNVIALAPVVAAALTAPAAAQPYLGRWTENPAWCANTRASGTDELPIVITRRAIETFASACRVVSVARQGAAWRLRTTCRDEGQTEQEPRTSVTFVLRLDRGRLILRDDTGTQTLTRCKP